MTSIYKFLLEKSAEGEIITGHSYAVYINLFLLFIVISQRGLSMRLNKQFATFYGIVLGDGCLSKVGKHHFISISGHKKDDYAFFVKINPIINNIRNKETNFRMRRKYGKIEFNFCDKKLFEKLASISFPVGKKVTQLIINYKFNNFKRFVIKGLFATDGSLVLTNNNGTLYPRLEISSISKGLLEQVSAYLKLKGIKSKVYISKKYQNNWNTLFRLQSNGQTNLLLFRRKIGFLNPKHEDRFHQYKKSVGGGI
ncbi:hypothetical protein H8D36_00435 [archaeon]|nr:hypothetical protein [archaeon]MBL7057581.1 hypothetical protein [Candidatus Woesearchaeota archaeon]